MTSPCIGLRQYRIQWFSMGHSWWISVRDIYVTQRYVSPYFFALVYLVFHTTLKLLFARIGKKFGALPQLGGVTEKPPEENSEQTTVYYIKTWRRHCVDYIEMQCPTAVEVRNIAVIRTKLVRCRPTFRRLLSLEPTY